MTVFSVKSHCPPDSRSPSNIFRYTVFNNGHNGQSKGAPHWAGFPARHEYDVPPHPNARTTVPTRDTPTMRKVKLAFRVSIKGGEFLK